MIKLQDFAKQYGVTDRAIQKHLKKHEKELEGHFDKRGPNGTWLDEYACDFIRGLMKQQPMVISEEDPRVGILEAEKKELEAQLREANTAFQKYVSETTSLLVKASQQIELAEKSEVYKKKNDELEAQNGVLRADNDKKDELLAEAEKTAQELSQKLTEEKNRAISFKEYWQRRK